MHRLPAYLVSMSRSSHDLPTILDLGARAAATITESAAAVLMVEGRRLNVAASHDEVPDRLDVLTHSLSAVDLDTRSGAFAHCLQTGQNALIEVAALFDVGALGGAAPGSSHWLGSPKSWVAELDRGGAASLGLAPLLAGDHALGVLVIMRRSTDPPLTTEVFQKQAVLAGHLATFVDNATALTQMRQSSLVVDAMPDAIIGFSRDRDVILWNGGAERMYGISEEEALGQRLDDLFTTEYGPPGAAGSAPGGPAISLINKGVWTGRVRQRTRSGKLLHVDVSIASIIENGVLRGAVSMNRDISALVEAEERRAEHERRLQALLDASKSMTAVFDRDGQITAVNTAWQAHLNHNGGIAATGGVGANYLEVLRRGAAGSPDARAVLAGIEDVLAGRVASFEYDYDSVAPDGTVAAYVVNVAPMPGATGGAFATHTDISGRKAMERQLEHQASYDSLTGLRNRRRVELDLVPELAAAASTGTAVGAIILDLDRFKDVNDTMGHAHGDRVLMAMGERLRGVRGASMIGRFAGDEFAMIVPGVHDRAELRRIAADVQRCITAPLAMGDRELFFGVNIGTALSLDTPTGPDAAADLLRAADTAMYRAKERGRNSIVSYDEGLRADAERRVKLSGWLERALERKELNVLFQPQFRCLDGRQVGVEALVRWHHPQAGNVSPAEFITIAEESGAIIPIGTWVLSQACQLGRDWVDVAEPDFSVAVNLSPLQLISPSLLDTVRDVLLRSRMPASSLTLEVTEGALIEDPDAASQALAGMRALGLRIAIDDFGTGYSSLAYLARFPVDELKVDRAFVRDIERDPRNRALAESIVRIGHALGMRVVAEGVETPGQLRILTGCGADCYQGYIAARPLSATEITRRLAAGGTPDLIDAEVARAAGRPPWT